jgi:hypothetical protein
MTGLLDLPNELLVLCWEYARPEELARDLQGRECFNAFMRTLAAASDICRRLRPIVRYIYADQLSLDITTAPEVLLRWLRNSGVGDLVQHVLLHAYPVDWRDEEAGDPAGGALKRQHKGVVATLARILPRLQQCHFYASISGSQYVRLVAPELAALPITSLLLFRPGIPHYGNGGLPWEDYDTCMLDASVLQSLMDAISAKVTHFHLHGVAVDNLNANRPLRLRSDLTSLVHIDAGTGDPERDVRVALELLRACPGVKGLGLSDCADARILAAIPPSVTKLAIEVDTQEPARLELAVSWLGRCAKITDLSLFTSDFLDLPTWQRLLPFLPSGTRTFASNFPVDEALCLAMVYQLSTTDGLRTNWLPGLDSICGMDGEGMADEETAPSWSALCGVCFQLDIAVFFGDRRVEQ